mmetsp:Transcript_106362/g.310991  ORF Transcript_106362/g.310991 Transcript_106362/m.310991 type:complete len:190 (+) Transcript_106362:38-607(+)
MPRLLAALLGDEGEAPLLGHSPSSASAVPHRCAGSTTWATGCDELTAAWAVHPWPRSWRGRTAAAFLQDANEEGDEAKSAESHAEIAREALEEATARTEAAQERADQAEEAEDAVLGINIVATVTLVGIAIGWYQLYKRWQRNRADLLRCYGAAGGALPGARLAGTGALPPASVPGAVPADSSPWSSRS